MINITNNVQIKSNCLKISEDIIFNYILYYLDRSDCKRSSLVLFFAHEIFVFFLTAHARSLSNDSWENNTGTKNIRFGYRGSRNVFSAQRSRKAQILDFLSILVCSTSIFRPVLIGCTSYNRIQLIKDLVKKRHFPIFNEIFNRDFQIPNFEKEIFNLKSLVNDLCDYFNFSEFEKKSLSNEVETIANTLFLYSTHKPKFLQKKIIKARDNLLKKSKYAVIGSGANFHNRLLSFLAVQYGVPVRCILHNGECGLTDIPINAVDDWAIADYMIGYGPAGERHAISSEYISRLSEAKYITSGSYLNSINDLHLRDDRKSKWKNLEDMIYTGRGLYVESRLRTENFITDASTYFDIKDEIKWREFLYNNLPNLHIKPHPKGNVDINVFDAQKYEFRRLDLAINDYDFLLFDNACSSAFTHVALNRIPVLLVERNIFESFSLEGIEYINSRCSVFSSRSVFQNYFDRCGLSSFTVGYDSPQDFMVKEQQRSQYKLAIEAI